MTYDQLIQRKRERLFGSHFPALDSRGVEIDPLSCPLTTQINDLEFYVKLEKSEILTDCNMGAVAALEGALWPNNCPPVPELLLSGQERR